MSILTRSYFRRERQADFALFKSILYADGIAITAWRGSGRIITAKAKSLRYLQSDEATLP